MTKRTHDFYADVTDFIFLRDEPAPADLILLPGSGQTGHLHRAAEIFHAGFAPLILPSGLHGRGLDQFQGDEPSEWAYMQSRLLALGVPREAILREDRATFTWENALFSRRVTDALGLRPLRAILCCRPFHARRALIYYQAAFPDTRFLVCPGKEAGVDREDWFLTEEGRSRVFSEMEKCARQARPQAETLLQAKEDN